jgi:hypothetical protein
MNSFGKKHTMHVGAERPDSSGLSFERHTCFLLIPPASTPDSSSVEPFSFGFSSNQVGTIVPSATHTHGLLLLHDQPTCDQRIFSLVDH